MSTTNTDRLERDRFEGPSPSKYSGLSWREQQYQESFALARLNGTDYAKAEAESKDTIANDPISEKILGGTCAAIDVILHRGELPQDLDLLLGPESHSPPSPPEEDEREFDEQWNGGTR